MTLPPARSLVIVAVLGLASLAGCITANPDLDPGSDAVDDLLYYLVDEFPIDVDHDHANATLHNRSLNVELSGFHSCSPDGHAPNSPRGLTDIAFHGPYAIVGTATGFCILDVTQPTMPAYVSSYLGEYSADIEVSTDGNYAFLLTQRNRIESLNDPPADPDSNLPRGVTVVNIRDKTKPTFESYYPVPTNGVHTATSYAIGTRQLLFIQSYDWFMPRDLAPDGVERPVVEQNLPVTQRVEITELVPAGGKLVLKRLAHYSLDRPLENQLVHYFPHDSYAQWHPLLKKHLLYVAYWDAGLVVLDIDDPASPKFLGRYSEKAPSKYNQYHDVKVFDELIDGRHITVTGPETQVSTEAAMVRVFDTTDPRDPVQLGTWRLPGNVATPGGFVFSPHVFTLNDGRIYIGHNHGGVWVIDVHNETLLKSPASAGYYFPRGDEAHREYSPGSDVWGAYWRDGYVYATESNSGVHVLHFASDAVPEPPEMAGHEEPHA